MMEGKLRERKPLIVKNKTDNDIDADTACAVSERMPG